MILQKELKMFLSESEASVFLGRILQEKEMGITIIEQIVNGLIKDLENDSIKKQEVLGELNKIKKEIGKI